MRRDDEDIASPQAALSDLLTLAGDRSEHARLRLAEELGHIAAMVINTSTHPDECALMNDIFAQLIRETEVEVRKRIARELCALDWVDKDIIFSLATDQIDVARPVLERSGLLDDQDLTRIVRQTAIDHRLVIASRPGIGEMVTDALVEFNEPPVMLAMLRNNDAALSVKGLDYLCELSKYRTEYRGPLLRRQNLPGDVSKRLLNRIVDMVRDDIAAKYRLPKDSLDQIAKHAAEDLATLPAGEDRTPLERATVAFANELERKKSSQPERLWHGHIAVFETRLMVRTGLNTIAIRTLIHDFAPFGIALLARRANMTLDDFREACTAIYGDRVIAGKARRFSFAPFEHAFAAITDEASKVLVERLVKDPALLRNLDISTLVRGR